MSQQLTQRESERYQRQVIMRGFGLDGQLRLKNSRVLCVGAGGLGSPALLYLAAAGVGTVGVIDDDVVDRSNLHRQVIHGESGLGAPKTESAAQRMREINPDIEIITWQERFTADNAASIMADFDVVLDGADNFPTRYLVNDAAVLAGIPCVHGSIFDFEGQVSVFDPAHGGPCYRCLFPEPPKPGTVPSCAEAGVLGVLPGTIGSLMATEAIKILTGMGTPLRGRLLHYDALSMETRVLDLQADPGCDLCGDHASIHEVAEIVWDCALPAEAAAEDRLSPETYRQWRDERRPHLLVDVREPVECAAGAFPPDARHLNIPLGDLPQRLDEILAAQHGEPVVCLCQGGVRSLKAADFLRSQGLDKVLDVGDGWQACRSWAFIHAAGTQETL